MHQDDQRHVAVIYFLSALFGVVVALFVLQLPWQFLHLFIMILGLIAIPISVVALFYLHKWNKLLNQSLYEKNKLISFASHEIRKIITIIKWGCELLLSKSPNTLTIDQVDMIRNFLHESNAMNKLTTDFLNISKSDLHRLDLVLKPVSFGELQKELIARVNRYGNEASEKHITISYDISLDPSLYIHVDLSRIIEIVDNLITNALQYTPEHGAIVVKVSHNAQNLTFTIKDSGIGIPVEDQKKLFHEFFRSENARKYNTSGTGIGLYLCKQYITGHGGEISFVSEIDKGTSFTFTLPLKKDKLEEVLKVI